MPRDDCFGRDAEAAPTFTVVINTYNYLAFLPQAIGSIVAQTCADHELIVVDDGSTDGSLAYLDALDLPFIVLRTERLGQARACLKAIARARGRYIYILDADDLAAPDLLETVARHLAGGPSKVQFRLVPVDEDGLPFAPAYPVCPPGYGAKAQRADIRRTGAPISPPTSGNVFRRDLFDAVGDIDYETAIDGVTLLLAPFLGEVVSLERVPWLLSHPRRRPLVPREPARSGPRPAGSGALHRSAEASREYPEADAASRAAVGRSARASVSLGSAHAGGGRRGASCGRLTWRRASPRALLHRHGLTTFSRPQGRLARCRPGGAPLGTEADAGGSAQSLAPTRSDPGRVCRSAAQDDRRRGGEGLMSGSFVRNSVVNAVAGACVTLGGFTSSVVVARLLGVAGTGIMAYAAWSVTVAIIVADVGMPGALSRLFAGASGA